jgi:hypothetical protein
MRDYAFFTHNQCMELEKLAMLIAEEFVLVLAEAFDAIVEPEIEEEAAPKVMIAGSR